MRAPPSEDRYEKRRRLEGRGDAATWLVEDRRRPGVSLTVRELPAGDDALRRGFAGLRRLNHPGLMRLHHLEPAGAGNVRLVFEHVDGAGIVETLAGTPEAERPGRLLDLVAEALHCLGFLHDFGTIHGGLKPNTVQVRKNAMLGCRLVLLDFAPLLRPVPAEDRDASGAWRAADLPYTAPELLDRGSARAGSDLYAFAAVVFEAIHGRPPFVGKDPVALVDAIRTGRRPRPRVPAPYPPGLTDWIELLLSPDPAERPATPAEALVALNAACATRYPTQTAAGRLARLRSGPPPGRNEELRAIRAELVPSIESRVILIHGDPGSGKRRLLLWLAGEAQRSGWSVERLTAHTVATQVLLGRLRERTAGDNTLVLIDNCDLDNPALATVLDRASRRREGPQTLIVAAIAPSTRIHPALRRLLDDRERPQPLLRIDLEPLGAAEIRRIVERVEGGTVTEERVRALLEASGGNPLLLETLIVEGLDPGEGTGEPFGFRESIRLRLDRLSEAGRTWLEALSLLAPHATEPWIARTAGLDNAVAEEAANEVTLAGLAGSDGRLWNTDTRAVRDHLIRNLEPTRRAALYRMAALSCSELPANEFVQLGRLAQLWSAAGDTERAAAIAREAAKRAVGEEYHREAAELFALALRNTPRRGEKRLDTRLAQGAALRLSGRPQAAARAFGAALALVDTPALRADVLARQSAALVLAGRLERARAVAEEARDLAQRLDLPRVHAEAIRTLGVGLARGGHGRRALPLLRESVRTFEREGDGPGLAAALQGLALCEANEGEARAERHFQRATQLYQQQGASQRALMNSVGLASVYQRRGEFGPARDLLEETRELAATRGNLMVEGIASATLAKTLFLQGRYAEAWTASLQGEDQGLHLGEERLVFVCRSVTAEILSRCGRADDAAELMERTLERRADRVDPAVRECVLLALAAARIGGTGADDSLLAQSMTDSLERCRQLNDPDNLLWCLALELERRASPGRTEPVGPVHLELEALLARGGPWDQPHFRARADLARARSELARGNPTRAADLANEVRRLAEGLDLPLVGAEAAALLTESRLAKGETVEAAGSAELGRHLLERTARWIGDTELHRGFVEHSRFDGLRRGTGLPVATASQRLVTLYEMSRVLNSAGDPEALLESILDMALEVVRAERGLILLRDADSGEFTVRLARNLEQETMRDAEEFSRSVALQASSGRAVLAVDTAADERIRDFKSVSMYGIQSVVCVPLRTRGKIVGAVYVDSRSEGSLFAADDLEFLEAFADHAALALENARIRSDLERENDRLQVAAESRVHFGSILGDSPAMQETFALIEKVAASELPVLIHGESGTGKELVARAIHYNGPRRKQTFVTENCAAIPEALLQSELFGHMRGAFTGADRDRQGLFELADGGTLFLDEIGDMSASMQAQLLRVLQEGEVRRVGGDRPFEVDVRVVAATHRDLQEEVAAGRFREDLMYRLQVLVLPLPPLRDRVGDVALLATRFLERISKERDRPTPRLATDVMDALESYDWPGNVRQLENTIQRLALLAGSEPITCSLVEQDAGLSRMLLQTNTESEAPLSLQSSEKEQIRNALAASKGNRSRAARLLGISRATIYRKIREFEL